MRALAIMFSFCSACSMAPYYARVRVDARQTAVACGIRNGWIDGARQMELEQYLTTVPIKFVNGMPNCGGPTLGTDLQMNNPVGCYHPKAHYEQVTLIDWDQCDTQSEEEGCTEFRYDSSVQDTAVHETIHALTDYLGFG